MNSADAHYSNKWYADQFTDLFLKENTRYCEKWGTWLVWDTKRWKENSEHIVLSYFDTWIEQLGKSYHQAEDNEEREKIHKSIKGISSISAQRKILEYSTRSLLIEPDQLDQNIYLLNFLNGTVDLRSGEISPHNQADSITKLVEYNYDKEASCQRWDQFLLEIMGHSSDMADFLQLVSGYGATGSVREQALFMCYGAGSNGKSTFCETLLELISDYSESVTHDFFALNKTDTHMTAIADMVGKRYVIGSEFTGNRMNEPMIKRLTGGDTIKARRMRQDYFQFKPTHSFFILVNDRPNIIGTDEGIWRRLKLIPFTVHFSKEQRDEDLKDKLVSEAEGILNWLLQGALRWFETGLVYPELVEGASSEYRTDMDAFGQFLQECTQRANDKRVASASLLDYYHRWCDTNGIMFKPDSRWLSKEMPQRGYEKKRSGGTQWLGIEMLADAIDSLSFSDAKFGQVAVSPTLTSRGNGQHGQVDTISAREETVLSDNGFHLSTCPNVDIFNQKDLNQRVAVLISQDFSKGLFRQDLDYEAVYEELYEEYLTVAASAMSELFLDNLEILNSYTDFENQF